MAQAIDTGIEKNALRQVLGHFVTGVTVVTTVDAQDRPWGLTANSFSSVSLDPPLVLWSQSLAAPSHPAFRDSGRFAINILAETQLDVSRRFSSGAADKFSATPSHPGLGGVALIDGCTAHIECRTERVYEGGDHAIFLGRVERIGRTGAAPLAFAQGRYMVARPHLAAELAEIAAQLHAPGSAAMPTPTSASAATLPGQRDLSLLQLRHRAVALAAEAADGLSQRIGQAVAVAVWGNHGPTVVHWRQPREGGMHLIPGFVMPVSDSATGLAFAAHLPASATEALLGAERNARTAPGKAATGSAAIGDALARHDAGLAEAIEHTHRHGLACVRNSLAFDEVYGGAIDAMSAPVFARGGVMTLALSMVARAGEMDCTPDGPLAQALTETAAGLSRSLGHPDDNTDSRVRRR